MISQNERPNVLITILRWIAVLPASIAAFVAIATILWFVQRFFSWGEGAWANFFDTIWNGFLGGLAWVYAGAYTAPIRSKLPVAVVLAILLAMLIGAVFLGIYIAPGKQEHGVAAVLQLIMSMIGAGVAVHGLKDES